jgi:tetratricopeptide (TPR) repeat protein
MTKTMHCMLAAFGFGVGMLAAQIAIAQQAEQAYAIGNEQLTQGDLRAALKSYALAVQADRSNQQYAQQFLLVRQVLLLHQAMDTETDVQRWNQSAQALRTFYASRGMHQQALPVDEAVFAREKSANAAIQLAETRLALGDHAAAADALSGLEPERVTPGARALLAIALARQGKQEEARQVAEQVTVSNDAGPGTLYLVARMHGAAGEDKVSMEVLRRCFEAVPPSRLDDLKQHARTCPDFASVSATAAFAAALQTASKVAESACSGGSSCSSCPMRTQCASGGH